MSQRFKVTNTLYRICDCLFIDYTSLSKFNSRMKPFPYKIFKYVNLNFTHNSRMNFLQFFIPHYMQTRFFLFKCLHVIIKLVYIVIFLRCNFVCHNRFKYRHFRIFLNTQSHARISLFKPRYGTYLSCLNLINRSKFISRINPNLIRFFVKLFNIHLSFEFSACHFKICQPFIFIIS